MTSVNHDHDGFVDACSPLKVCAKVAHQIPPLTCTEFVVVKHGHRCVNHDQARTAFLEFSREARRHGSKLVRRKTTGDTQRNKGAWPDAKLSKPRRKPAGIKAAGTVDPVHDVTAGQRESYPSFCNRPGSSPMPTVAKQHMNAGLAGAEIGRSARTDGRQRMHEVHRTTLSDRAGGESCRWPVT